MKFKCIATYVSKGKWLQVIDNVMILKPHSLINSKEKINVNSLYSVFTYQSVKLNTLINEIAIAVGLIFPCICCNNLLINWWGTTKIKISASLVASTTSGTAICNLRGKKL